MQIIDLDEHCVIKWRLADICNYKCSYCIRRPLANIDKNVEEDFNTALSTLPEVVRIAKELYERNNKQVKIDLIGGEISIFDDLGIIVSELAKCECICKVNITTNMYRDIGYYLALCHSSFEYGKALTITSSYHAEHADLNEWMDKATILSQILGDRFKCETVITNVNDKVDEFISRCEAIGCRYMAEEDLFDPTKRGQTVKNYKPNYRYKVIDDEGKEGFFYTRNEVVKTYGENGVAISTCGKKCTRDFDYVYIEKDMGVYCLHGVPIKDYHVLESHRICGKSTGCTLCGHMSIID